ncbi:MAG: 3-phosphoshikimate 1-carboxyvinyltransferase [Nitrospirae bacterium]|nr:3-phosphoshikimate 1-carboxyvinyltransferase [Nitrospirota bacterium]MBF0535892.1 3-phosphoshikimate 1-carboxyvinyltransferase [Nitrospirota bacterium]MBF0617775.1 3-phosphoshikimate 1-carboxyvinyltransferase [Nitrospirota bacterium]
MSENVTLSKAGCLKGELRPPPDKSISHRAVFISSIANGTSYVKNFLSARDPEATLNAFRALGVDITERKNELVIAGRDLKGLKEPADVIDCMNSGTTMRLLLGVLSGCSFFSVLTGDSSLRNRPMARVTQPLRLMKAEFMGREDGRYPPIAVKGGKLTGITYKMPISSAQVKSSLLLAGLNAEGRTTVIESVKSRDHTERMLKTFGANISVDGLRIKIDGTNKLTGSEITVPGDISSAAFFLAGAALVADSEVVVRGVGLNKTRTGFLDALNNMGANAAVQIDGDHRDEPQGDICVKYTDGLKAITLGRSDIPALIDEFPILCVLGLRAHGVTEVRGAEELRVKESDRIKAMVGELRKMGAVIEEYPDGVAIEGPQELHGAVVESHGDHRIAMALSIAALIAKGETTISGISSVEISYPGFFENLRRLIV